MYQVPEEFRKTVIIIFSQCLGFFLIFKTRPIFDIQHFILKEIYETEPKCLLLFIFS